MPPAYAADSDAGGGRWRGLARHRKQVVYRAGTQFACFTGTKVQILTQLRQVFSRYLPLDDESAVPALLALYAKLPGA